MTRGRWLSVCVLAMTACGDPEILGETACSQDSPDCQSAVELPEADNQSGLRPEAVSFDIEAQEARPARWTALVPAPGGAERDGWQPVDVAPAPDGGTWVSWLTDGTQQLIRLDDAGREVAAYSAATRDRAPEYILLDNHLTVSPTLRPIVEWRDDARALLEAGLVEGTAFGLDDKAGLVAIAAPAGLTPVRTLAGPGDTVRRVSFDRDSSLSVHEHRATGELNWTRRIELPGDHEDLSFDRRNATPEAAITAAGSTLVQWPVLSDLTPNFTIKILSLIDARGNLKWHMTFIRDKDFVITFAPLATGGLAIATDEHDGFHLYTLDEDGKRTASWRPLPASHHGGMPSKLASDAEGNLYFATATGPRRAPQLTVCKVRATDDGVPPHCIDVEGVTGGALQVESIASPSPNSVVVGYGTSAQPLTGPFSWAVSRLDF